tara:strand:+ start:203 stop:727 length:525 start_codon:yes stop_codon:yes gene_type:complete
LKKKKYKIGLLGGTFDPAHAGHVKISKEAKKRYNLKKVIWAVTKKNPFKNKTKESLKQRILFAKKINKKNKFIKVIFFENKIKSNKTIDLINYLRKNKSNYKIYLIMGADNLINFHKWKKYDQISLKCNILVFNRATYKTKSLKSVSFKKYNKKNLKFINFKKINISSSQLRKI